MSMNVNTTGTVYGSYQNTYKAGTVDKKKETAKTTENDKVKKNVTESIAEKNLSKEAQKMLKDMRGSRTDKAYEIDDIILCEYGTTVVGLEMMRSVNEENAEEVRKKQIVKSAMSTLSASEVEAIKHVFKELDGTEGILVASKIADSVGITRSVIVNALRKFESAGVIESRSSGMKGTYIKVTNEVVYDELKKLDDW